MISSQSVLVFHRYRFVAGLDDFESGNPTAPARSVDVASGDP
jgi:hypothetical protein